MIDFDAYLERLSEAKTFWRKEKQEAAEKHRELLNLAQKLGQDPTPEWLNKQLSTSLNYENESSKCLTFLEHTYEAAKRGSI